MSYTLAFQSSWQCERASRFLQNQSFGLVVTTCQPSPYTTTCCCEAFAEKGFPEDPAMTTDAKAYIIRPANVIHPDELRGSGLNFDSCFSSVHPVCEALVKLESPALAAEYLRLHSIFCRWCDKYGKEVANSVTKLIMLEGRSGDLYVRHFALLVRAGFNPKYQQWAVALHEATATSHRILPSGTHMFLVDLQPQTGLRLAYAHFMPAVFWLCCS